MTKLQTISHNHISLECRCGHGALVSVKQLLEKLQPCITVQQVVAKARYTKCGALGAQDKNNKVIGAWAIGIGLATVFAIITAIAGAEAEVIWGQFVVWPFLVFMLLEVDKPKK